MKTSIQKRTGTPLSLRKDERGLSTVEYVILLILIAVVGIAGWTTFGEKVSAQIEEANGEIGGLGQ